MVTLKDVAERAGVSPATVSYVLRGGRHVSQWTDERVRKAASELGYATNMAARSLKYGKTGVIELVVRGLDVSSIYARMVTYVKHACADRGYRSLVMQTEQDPQTMREAVGAVNSMACDGMLLDSCDMPSTMVRDLSQNQPIVILDDPAETLVFDTILIPHEQEMFAATEHLVARGCRNIAFVGASATRSEASMQRYDATLLCMQGFRRAMGEAGLRVGSDRLIAAEWRYFKGVDVGHDLIARGFDYDGFVCCNDALAAGLIRGLADGGVMTPRDVKVIGGDGATIDEYLIPRLSTVQIDMPDLVDKGIGMLVERIEGRYAGEPRRMVADCALVTRESTGAVPDAPGLSVD